MDKPDKKKMKSCKIDTDDLISHREKLPDIVDKIMESCADESCYSHVAYEPIPSKESVTEIIDRLKEILFPGYFSRELIDPVNLKYSMGQSVSHIFDMLSDQICKSIRHGCFRYDNACRRCEEEGREIALCLLQSIPDIQKILATDVRAAYDGDPAAKSYDEIIFCYPGIFAIWIYRIAHRLWDLDVPFLPRIKTEYAHSVTGIDIHPGAEIGEKFVIDHGTGVVIGETCKIGNNVRLYQGVTLGALSLPKDAGERLRNKKRHPTIEDDVIIYAGATILGGDTVIGARSVIGGNVWITESIPPDTKVLLKAPELIFSNRK